MKDLGYTILGISPQNAKSKAKFKEKNHLTLDFICDEDTSIAQAFGVWQEKKLYTSGQLVGLTLLSTVDVSLLAGNNLRFSVGSGTVEDMTVSVNGNSLLTASGLLTTIVNLLGAGNTLKADLSVVNTVTGEVVAIAENSVSISASLLGGLSYNGTVSFANLPAGDYTMVISAPESNGTLVSLINALAAAQVASFVNVDVTDSVGYSVGAIEGNVLDTTASGDMQDSGQGISVTSAVSDSVDGSTPVNVTSAGVDITGAYGVLTIHSEK